MFMPHRPTDAIKTVGLRSIACAGPDPLPKISPTSWVDDMTNLAFQLAAAGDCDKYQLLPVAKTGDNPVVAVVNDSKLSQDAANKRRFPW